MAGLEHKGGDDPLTEFPDWLIQREKDVIAWALEQNLVAPIADAGDFAREAHGIIWRAVLALKALSRPVDYLSVRAALARLNQLDGVGAPYLHELARDSIRPSLAALEAAASDIQQAARDRRTRAVLRFHANKHPVDLERLACDLRAQQPFSSPVAMLDDVAIANVPEPEWIVSERLPARSLCALVGASGVGKTFVALDLGLSVATGRAWLKKSIHRSAPVVHVAAEGSTGPRILGWKIAHGFNIDAAAGLHTWPSAISLLEPSAVGQFIEAARPIGPCLVILDTLARCLMGGDENSAKDMGLAIAAMDRIRTSLDTTVLVVHHTNKSESSERGSGALRGACDALWFLTQADDLLQLTCEKLKDRERFEPVNLKLVSAYIGASTCIVRCAEDAPSDGDLTDNQLQALDALTDLFHATGATWAEWEAALPSMKRATRYRARKVLIEQGYVREKGQRFVSLKTPVSRRLSPVSQSSDASSQAVL